VDRVDLGAGRAECLIEHLALVVVAVDDEEMETARAEEVGDCRGCIPRLRFA
jgi:hypothetical protein